MKNREPSLAERKETAAKAKQAQLERARAKAPSNDPKFAERQAERAAVARAREGRIAERKVAKLAEAERLAAQQITDDAARAVAVKTAHEASLKAIAERDAQEAALAVERKDARDARYAARKARQK